MEIDVWTSEGKKSVSVDDCLAVTTKGSDFYVECKDDVFGEISLDSLYAIFDAKPEVIDEKALELRKTRETLKVLFRDTL